MIIYGLIKLVSLNQMIGNLLLILTVRIYNRYKTQAFFGELTVLQSNWEQLDKCNAGIHKNCNNKHVHIQTFFSRGDPKGGRRVQGLFSVGGLRGGVFPGPLSRWISKCDAGKGKYIKHNNN